MPEKAKLRLERVNLGSERAEFSPKNADLRSGRANLRPEMVDSGL